MTNLLSGFDADKLKPGDLLRVVPKGKKDFQLVKLNSKKQKFVLLVLRESLYRVLKARATLFDNSIENECVEMLDEVMSDWVEIAGDEFEIQYKDGKGRKSTKGKAKK